LVYCSRTLPNAGLRRGQVAKRPDSYETAPTGATYRRKAQNRPA